MGAGPEYQTAGTNRTEEMEAAKDGCGARTATGAPALTGPSGQDFLKQGCCYSSHNWTLNDRGATSQAHFALYFIFFKRLFRGEDITHAEWTHAGAIAALAAFAGPSNSPNLPHAFSPPTDGGAGGRAPRLVP